MYLTEDVGKSKAIVSSEKLKKRNPHSNFTSFNEVLNQQNAEKIISQFNIVVDGSDNFFTRYLINDTCVKLNLPLVYGSILNFEGQVAVFNSEGSKNLRDLFPEAPGAEDVPNCDGNGVLGTLPGIIATIMAQETLKLILGMEILKNQILIFDTRDWALARLTY